MTPEVVAAVIRKNIEEGTEVHVRFDFDGTVAELQMYPEESLPHPTAFAAYEKLIQVDGVDVGVITGRFLDFAMQHFPESFELDCSYGMESRHDGVIWQHPEIAVWKPKLELFTGRVIDAAKELGLAATFSAREAANTDAIYLEAKPAAVGLHDVPAKSANTNSAVDDAIAAVIAKLGDDFNGLDRHDNNGNVEFAMPLADDGGAGIDKGTVIDALDGFIVFSADDTGDLPAARKIKDRGGIVLAVNHLPDELRRGSPPELIAMADVVFQSVEAHAEFISAVTDCVTG